MGPLLFVYQGFQDAICFPKTISLHLGSDPLLYLPIPWIDQRVISITWAVIFSFNQCTLEPMNTLFYGKKPTRANVGGMVGEYPASCLPVEVLLESLAQLPSGNTSSGLILFSTSVRFTETTAGLGTVSWLVGRGPRHGRRCILYVRSEACGEEFIVSVHIGFSQKHVKAHLFHVVSSWWRQGVLAQGIDFRMRWLAHWTLPKTCETSATGTVLCWCAACLFVCVVIRLRFLGVKLQAHRKHTYTRTRWDKEHTRVYEHWDLILGNLVLWHLPICPLECMMCPQCVSDQPCFPLSTVTSVISALVTSHLC